MGTEQTDQPDATKAEPASGQRDRAAAGSQPFGGPADPPLTVVPGAEPVPEVAPNAVPNAVPTPGRAPGATPSQPMVRLGPNTYLNPSTGQASFVPTDLALLPVAPVGFGPAAATADGQLMQVRAESLDAFRQQIQRAYQEAFGASSSPAAPARFASETSIVPRQLGDLTETQTVHAAYQPLQQQMHEVLQGLDQLVMDLHTKIGRTNEQYQFSEQTATDALSAARNLR